MLKQRSRRMRDLQFGRFLPKTAFGLPAYAPAYKCRQTGPRRTHVYKAQNSVLGNFCLKRHWKSANKIIR